MSTNLEETLSASQNRILDAIEFRPPDRLPRWDDFDIKSDGMMQESLQQGVNLANRKNQR